MSEIGSDSWAVAAIGAHKTMKTQLGPDIARPYGNSRSERVIAEVVQQRARGPAATKVPPVLASDWAPGPYDAIEQRNRTAHVWAEMENSLRDLQTECPDLIQIQTWSRACNRNPAVLEVLLVLQQQGKHKRRQKSTASWQQMHCRTSGGNE